eukprot:3362566-Prymnesium_polylepis.1
MLSTRAKLLLVAFMLTSVAAPWDPRPHGQCTAAAAAATARPLREHDGSMGPARWRRYLPDLCNRFFIEIGANCDTDRCAAKMVPGRHYEYVPEPIWQYRKAYNWSGAFAVLKANYLKANPWVMPINVAVSNKDRQQLDFWYPDAMGDGSRYRKTSERCTTNQHWASVNGWNHTSNHLAVPPCDIAAQPVGKSAASTGRCIIR